MKMDGVSWFLFLGFGLAGLVALVLGVLRMDLQLTLLGLVLGLSSDNVILRAILEELRGRK